jgi:alpha amylase-like protein
VKNRAERQTIEHPCSSAQNTLPRWIRFPTIFEVNTWVWLSRLRALYGEKTDLSSVPTAEWDALACDGVDAIWLMGVWERSPRGIAIANQNDSLFEEFRHALPDFHTEDNVGSPYCVREYRVDERLGGTEGLAVARRELARRGLKLILDFVPNHVAPDHMWTLEHPEFFVQGSEGDLKNDPNSFLLVKEHILACGRDPYFPAWPDVVQLNAFDPGLRRAVLEEIGYIASQCDGIRCDMAMLLLNNVFSRTWEGRVGRSPDTEFWADIIPSIKKQYPDFIFIAEAYWDLESKLQELGFDYCYDKRLYDRLASGSANDVRLHLIAEIAYQQKLVRFIENHDEPRAAAVFSPERERAAAIVMSTVPGARLFYQGQFEGKRVKLPVFLGRTPLESADQDLNRFYSHLLSSVQSPLFHDGIWSMCDLSGWPDNQSYRNLIAWTWRSDEERALMVVNLSGVESDGRVRLDCETLGGKTWKLVDAISRVNYERSGDEMLGNGLYVKLAPWAFHFFCFELAVDNETVCRESEEVAV